MKQCYRIAATLLLVLASVTLAGCSQRNDSFDWGRVVLFSAVSGKVVHKGKPVAGLTLTRTVTWADTISDTAVTDKDGHFSFPVIKEFSFVTQFIPGDIRISQSIKTSHQGKEYEIWTKLKSYYDNNGELFYLDKSRPYDPKKDDPSIRIGVIADLKKTPITVTCDLATEVRYRPNGGIDWDWFDSRGPKGGLGPYCLVD